MNKKREAYQKNDDTNKKRQTTEQIISEVGVGEPTIYEAFGRTGNTLA